MQIFDFISKEELDELPEDESAAFLEFVRIARRKLQTRISELDPQDENDSEVAHDARHGFVNVVTATARRLHIEPFASMEVPRVRDLSYEDYRQFIADVDHYMTQMLFDGRSTSRRQTVGLSDDAKTKIRSKLFHLREALEKSDYDERTRNRLRARLDEFEKELEKSRINIVAVAWVAIEILATPGALMGSYDASLKLINQIMQTVGEEKLSEDERRQLPPMEQPAALMPPRIKEKKTNSKADFGRGFGRDLDEEIPF
ncbi:hypothetical protein ATN84_01720 [Paramesorhizobium deserti]|uniref:Uncharacterized protein n=1 Tax=Paramesorhizobium deserti TaxID=1494590 RepID=A0A135HZA0_9HYPH|nr:hypothetical protein [Paramesorhizobium deserti]KXF78536.1 hypothetical protein ATN84_01720 [Paramesorhizobium deserti]